MSLFEAIRLAVGMIRAQKLKSFFSLVGAFVGVAFLIAVVSIVNGMDVYMKDTFAGKLFGVNTFTITYRPRVQMGDMSQEQWRALRRRPRLNEDDYRAVRARLEGRAVVAIESSDRTTVYEGGRRSRNVELRGVSDTYFRIRNIEIADGRAFSAQEVDRAANVVVIGADLATKFFGGGARALGHTLRIGDLPYRVIGVAKSQGKLFNQSLDKFAIAPFTSQVKKLVNPHRIVDGILVKAATLPEMQDAMGETEALMRSRRHLRPGQDNNFHFETADDVLDFWGKIASALFTGGLALMGISLVVGGIIIMNIMLMAVAERTREIGIRKALGARRRDILRQFLVEAAALSTGGAVLGIAVGVGAAKLIDAFTSLPAKPSLFWMTIALVLGMGTGIVAGVYPANRAAKLDPIAALRFE